MSANQPTSPVPDDLSSLSDTPPAREESMYVEPGTPIWHLHERLVLNGDDTMFIRTVPGGFTAEPHLGDVMDLSGFRVSQQIGMANEEGVLRFMPDDESMVFVPVGNVQGIYVDVIDPDGNEIPASRLKPGRQGADDD